MSGRGREERWGGEHQSNHECVPFRAQSRSRNLGRGEPSPGGDVGGVSPVIGALPPIAAASPLFARFQWQPRPAGGAVRGVSPSNPAADRMGAVQAMAKRSAGVSPASTGAAEEARHATPCSTEALRGGRQTHTHKHTHAHVWV